jgi:hypothetical protein
MHKYYKLVNQQTKNGFQYMSYKTVGYPMVLRSVADGRYLASLHTFYDDQWEGSQVCPMIIELERPPITDTSSLKQRYQVILPTQKDDLQVLTGRPIKYVITNLCHEGYIKIDLMRDDKPVNCVDPGGLNQVNELRPFESYEIKADQMNHNRRLMVKMKTKVLVDGTSESVILSDELSAQPAEKVGDYLWITVTPRTGFPTLEKSFADTIWTTSDYVIVSKPTPVDHSYASGGGGLFSHTLDDMPQAMPASFARGRESVCFDALCADVKTVKKSRSVDCEHIVSDESETLTETHAMTSKVGGYTHGDKLTVVTGRTGVSYRYDLHSPVCIIGLSFLEGNYTVSKNVSTKDEIDEMLAKLDSAATTEMLAHLKTMKTFKSEECVICLDSKPNVILMRCGHICTCKGECTNSLTTNVCPICRAHIIDKIDEKLLADV